MKLPLDTMPNSDGNEDDRSIERRSSSLSSGDTPELSRAELRKD